MPPKVLRGFEAWMRSVGIEHNRDAIKLVDAAEGCSGLALGVRAVRDVAEGERLCTIPKAACISIRTTDLADVIEAEELGGGLGLVLAVMHEMSLGPKSRWHGYFRSLPAREYLPLFWSNEQLELLRGTELEHSAESDRQAAAEDFEEHVLPLLCKYPERLRTGACTLPNFLIAASFVASRAFGVDEWHGDAMVPLADVFNHKASVVELGAGYEVHGAQSDEEEEEEGAERDSDSSSASANGSSSNEEERGSASGGEEGKEMAGKGVPAPASRQHQRRHNGDCCCSGEQHELAHGVCGGEEQAGVVGNALPAVTRDAPASIYGLSSANGLHLRLEMGIVDRDEETLEIVAASAVPAGAEVHNTYGELGNAELVKKYGFALRRSPFSTVTLNKARLLAAARAAAGATRWRQRSKLLQEQAKVLEEDEEPFEVLANGHISPALFVTLRVLCAPDDEAAGWNSIADALRLPATPASACGRDGVVSPEEEEEEEQKGQPELGAVQVWQVLDGNGQQLAAQPLSAAADAAAGEQQQQQGYAALLNRSMCELVQQAVRQRLAAYAAPLEQDMLQLEASQQQQQQLLVQQGTLKATDEELMAVRAALLLRITEKELLRDLLTALERRLAALVVTGKEQARETAGADGSGRGEAAGHEQQQQVKNKGKRKVDASQQQDGQQSDGNSRGQRHKQQRLLHCAADPPVLM